MNPAQNYLGGLAEALRQDGAILDESISALRREIIRLSNRHDRNMQNLVAKTQRQTQLLSSTLLPQPFSGLCSENATQFLREIGYYCDFTEVDNQGKCRLFPLLLRDRASLWYDSLPAGIVDNWDRLSGAFRAKFGPAAMNLVQEMTLLDRTQGENESVENYTVDMVRRLDMTSLPPEEKVKVYIKGLLPYIQTQVIDKGSETLDKAESLAKLAECLRPLQQEEVYKTVMSVQPKVVVSVNTSARELAETASPVTDSKLEKDVFEQMQRLNEQVRELQNQLLELQAQPSPVSRQPACNDHTTPSQCFACCNNHLMFPKGSD